MPAPRPSPPPAHTSAAARLDTPVLPLTGHPETVRRLLDWAARDAGAATLWADRLADPEQRREALQAICFKIAERDPRAAVDMAETFDLAGDPGVAANLVAQWSATDADAALAWVEQGPPGDARDELVARVAFALSAAEPGRAAQVVEEHMSAGSLQAEAAASVLQQWMRRDAAAAARWAEGLPPGELRDRARRELTPLARERD